MQLHNVAANVKWWLVIAFFNTVRSFNCHLYVDVDEEVKTDVDNEDENNRWSRVLFNKNVYVDKYEVRVFHGVTEVMIIVSSVVFWDIHTISSRFWWNGWLHILGPRLSVRLTICVLFQNTGHWASLTLCVRDICLLNVSPWWLSSLLWTYIQTADNIELQQIFYIVTLTKVFKFSLFWNPLYKIGDLLYSNSQAL